MIVGSKRNVTQLPTNYCQIEWDFPTESKHSPITSVFFFFFFYKNPIVLMIIRVIGCFVFFCSRFWFLHKKILQIHDKGLKFGIYQDYGTETCAGYPGIIDHMELDANTFAQWGIDYIKVDGCNADYSDMDTGYPEFGRLLNKTGRPMVYSCSWPVYQEYAGLLVSRKLWVLLGLLRLFFLDIFKNFSNSYIFLGNFWNISKKYLKRSNTILWIWTQFWLLTQFLNI